MWDPGSSILSVPLSNHRMCLQEYAWHCEEVLFVVPVAIVFIMGGLVIFQKHNSRWWVRRKVLCGRVHLTRMLWVSALQHSQQQSGPDVSASSCCIVLQTEVMRKLTLIRFYTTKHQRQTSFPSTQLLCPSQFFSCWRVLLTQGRTALSTYFSGFACSPETDLL